MPLWKNAISRVSDTGRSGIGHDADLCLVSIPETFGEFKLATPLIAVWTICVAAMMVSHHSNRITGNI